MDEASLGPGADKPMSKTKFDVLLQRVRACRICEAELPLGPRPVLRAKRSARVIIIGQAPGTKVHESGIPWNDRSGDRLRQWLKVEDNVFYDESRIAIVPMGFCYPGLAPSGGDAPPRPECAPEWHPAILAALPKIEPCLSGLHPHPLGLEWAQTGYRERAMDVLDRADLPFPHSPPEFQRLFPDDAACAAYLEKARWGDGFACPHCGTAGEPFHFENRPGVLRCRKCRQNTGLTVGTVMERSHTPLNVWFWAAYLVASQTPGMSAVQFQRQLGLSRYETAFQILHKLRSGMVRPNQDRIGGQPKNHVEVDETWVGGRTRGEGRGVHHKVPVSCAIEVRHRKPGTKLDNRKDGRYAGRVRLAVVLDRSAESLCGFVESTVAPGSLIVTDDWSGYAGLGKRGYEHFAVAECGDPEVAEQYLPIIHLVFANLKTWLIGIHHGVSHQHLQAYLNEFTFRFNRRFYPFNAFRSLLGIAGDTSAPTYAELYSGEWRHPTCSGHGR